MSFLQLDLTRVARSVVDVEADVVAYVVGKEGFEGLGKTVLLA